MQPMDPRILFKKRGDLARIAKAVRRHHSVVLRWRQVPIVHVRTVERLLGVSREALRPDVYGSEAAE